LASHRVKQEQVMSTRTSAGRIPAGARLGVVLLLVLAVATAVLAAPSVAAAEGRHGNRHGNNGGSGGSPGGASGGADASSDPNGAADSAESAGGSATVTTGLNLRAGPSTDSDVLTVMPAGSTVGIGGDPENGFYPVSFDGIAGYAYGDYLDFGGGSAAAPSDGGGGATADADAGESDIVAIIYAAADAYGQSREDMLRVATCESGLDPNNVTPPYDASGLFQFLPSTWATTPYADQDIFDPVANANAAAWMWSVGRRNEWVCQ
jgi:hypothetical protein